MKKKISLYFLINIRKGLHFLVANGTLFHKITAAFQKHLRRGITVIEVLFNTKNYI